MRTLKDGDVVIIIKSKIYQYYLNELDNRYYAKVLSEFVTKCDYIAFETINPNIFNIGFMDIGEEDICSFIHFLENHYINKEKYINKDLNLFVPRDCLAYRKDSLSFHGA